VLRDKNFKVDYIDAIKGEYTTELLEQEKFKRKVENMRDVYIVGLDHNGGEEKTAKVFHADATKNLKVRVEEKIGLRDEKLKNQTFEQVFETWQEKSLKQMYKQTDKKYCLIDKGEYELVTKITRVETLLNKNDLIRWSTERTLDYYLYCEKGVTEGVFIKVDVGSAQQGKITFGNTGGEEPPRKGFLNIDDMRLSKQHFEIEVDSDGNWLNIMDLGSQYGTWLVILNYLEDEILPEIEYQNAEIGAFKFELGVSCFSLEEIMEMYEAPEILSDLCLLGMYSLNDIREIKEHELETRIIKSKVTPDRVERVKEMMETLIKEFQNESVYVKNRLIMRVLTGAYTGVDIEVACAQQVGYRGSKIGRVNNKGVKHLVFTSFQNSDTFDENIFDVNFKSGSYYLKSYGFSKIYKKFSPGEKNRIFPGHRICAGSQIFTLLQ